MLAGGVDGTTGLARQADEVVRRMQLNHHYLIQVTERVPVLTDSGIALTESALGCPNLFDEQQLPALTAVQDALHAHCMLQRDVDYVVKNGSIECVDEWKGRIAQDRRWPAGLHTALEVKEGVGTKRQGTLLGSITVQNMVAQYEFVCGMTGTAATQSRELAEIYNLPVVQIPTYRPMIRIDHPDVILPTLAEKQEAVVEEIRREHASGRPVLVGTGSVLESEQLSALMSDVPHYVLNARDDDAEAGIIKSAGTRGAVTVSTNMAGRGVDIPLGEGVRELGGLHIIGTNRSLSRRVDDQLRGRAGRQGDPGSSRFFVSMEDPLLQKYGLEKQKVVYTPQDAQRVSEGQNLAIRLFLQKYEGIIESQRIDFQQRRREVLNSDLPARECVISLRTFDEVWSEYLASVAELRSGVHWISWGGRDPLHHFLTTCHQWYGEAIQALPDTIANAQAEYAGKQTDPLERGAVWTYLTTDQPFGRLSERFRAGVLRKLTGS